MQLLKVTLGDEEALEAWEQSKGGGREGERGKTLAKGQNAHLPS